MDDKQPRVATFPALEEVCPECEGKGRDGSEGFVFHCQPCDGTGFVLTPLGEQLFAFMEHATKRHAFRARA